MTIFTVAVAATMPASAQQQVDRKGATSKVMLEQVISSHLAPLNGKYKLQATETTYEPGGYTGLHTITLDQEFDMSSPAKYRSFRKAKKPSTRRAIIFMRRVI